MKGLLLCLEESLQSRESFAAERANLYARHEKKAKDKLA
jgi:hypothetical protein